MYVCCLLIPVFKKMYWNFWTLFSKGVFLLIGRNITPNNITPASSSASLAACSYRFFLPFRRLRRSLGLGCNSPPSMSGRLLAWNTCPPFPSLPITTSAPCEFPTSAGPLICVSTKARREVSRVYTLEVNCRPSTAKPRSQELATSNGERSMCGWKVSHRGQSL